MGASLTGAMLTSVLPLAGGMSLPSLKLQSMLTLAGGASLVLA